jgi:aryl-alcohol dehydrogenase-like predicted oxidoreductase
MPLIERLVLGTAQLGMPYGVHNLIGQPSRSEALEILRQAAEKGIRYIDTADAYGEAVQLVHAYHQDHPPFEVITKFRVDHPDEDLCEKLLIRKSLLGVERVYCFQFHHYKDLHLLNQEHRQLVALRESGLTSHVGVSVYSNEEFAGAIAHPLIDVIQLPFNLLDNDSKRGRLLEDAKRKGKEVHARSVFLQGLFFMAPAALPPRLQPLRASLERIRTLAAAHGIPVQALALNYVLHHRDVDKVLFGVDHAVHLTENLSAILPSFDEDLRKRIDDINVIDEHLLNPVNWQ